MTTWGAFEQAEPEFAGRVRWLFEAGRHKTIATLRADGSPRISMTGARKGADLRRDPRFALHGPTFHPVEGRESEWPGEAKIAERAISAGPVNTGEASGQPDGELFVADIAEVVITGLNAEGTRLVVAWWTPERGLRRIELDYAGIRVTNRSGMKRTAYRPGLSNEAMPGPISAAALPR
jgi:hypothetical protein